MILLKKSFTLPKISMLFLGVLGFTSIASAADIAGRVTFSLGEVVVSDEKNNKRSVFKGDLIRSGERIETLNNSRVQVRMTDGGTIILRPNSVFEITRYSFSKDNPDVGAVLFNFLKGGARAISGAIGKANRENYQFRTPVATIGIRGTDYSSSLNDEQLLVTVGQGQINLANDAGNANVSEGKTYSVKKNGKPALCHSDAGLDANTKVEVQPCSPILIPLETEEGIQFSKQTIKKPNADNFSSYGAFAEAMRRYEVIMDELSLLENKPSSPPLSSASNQQQETVTTLRNNAFFNFFVGNNLLNSTEMRDSSVIDAIGFSPVMPLSLLDAIHDKDPLSVKVFGDILSEDVVFDTGNALRIAKLKRDLEAFFETFLQNVSTTFLGSNSTVIGADFGTPNINVILGDTLFDGITIEFAPATRTKNHIAGLGVSNNLLATVDKNKNAILRGFSLKQGLLHDNDGIESNKNSGSIIIGNGSAQQATVVFTDDAAPIIVNLSLERDFRNFVSEKSVLAINVSTPKLAIKLGEVYVSNSDSSAANIDKDGNANLGAPAVLGTSQDGGKAVQIMGASEIVLGAATINARLEHNKLLRNYIIKDGVTIIPSLTIFADAHIREGLTINNLEIKDVAGNVKGGSLMMSSLKITDNASSNLTAKLAINVAQKIYDKSSLGGLVLTLDQLGSALNGLDVAINDVSVGRAFTPDIGDIQIIGLDLNGSRVILYSH